MENNEAPRGEKIGVILMTYGSATTAEHVRVYMEHVYPARAGSQALDEVIADFEERYRLVGHSPLIEITQEQAKFLENFLNDQKVSEDNNDDFFSNNPMTDSAPHYVVRAGMLHSRPFIEEAVRDCKSAGAGRLVGVILSPQFSSFIMDGYRAAFSSAAEPAGFSQSQIALVGPWPNESHFISLLADRVATALKNLREHYGENLPIVFTTHSLPQRVVERDPSYLEQLKATTDAILAELQREKKSEQGNGLWQDGIVWFSGYQSAGHTPEEWLKPDLTDILRELKDKNHKAVLIVPIQFLADHLEILYDLDIAARKQCDEFGISYHRIELPNTDPRFIESLANIAKSSISDTFPANH